MRLHVWILGIAGVMGSLAGGTEVPTGAEPAITLVVTGSELGALKPCGCSGGQLGGLDRRQALLDRVAPDRRLLLDTGRFVPSADPQDLIKLQILMQAYAMMGYDLLNVQAVDWEPGRLSGALEAGGPMALITADPGPDQTPSEFSKSLAWGDRTITVRVKALLGKAFQAGSADLGDPVRLPETLTVLLVDTTDLARPETLPWQDLDVDCVIVPLDGDDPQTIGAPGKRPLVCSPGRYGRHVLFLTVQANPQTGVLQFRYDAQRVSEDLEKDSSLVELYRMYQLLVRETDLLENHPKLPLPGPLEYAGSVSCRDCHEEPYRIWSTLKHAHAFQTLVDVGSQRDPECVVCHVVGMDYDSGFVSHEETPELTAVGCEVCHGPGSEHNRSAGKIKMPQPQWDCLKCHTPEHSGGFAGHEQEYREKIRHWTEPNATDVVKD